MKNKLAGVRKFTIPADKNIFKENASKVFLLSLIINLIFLNFSSKLLLK